MSFYPPVDAMFMPGAGVTSILIQVLVLVTSLVFSLFGMFGVMKYGPSASERWGLLAVVFFLVNMIFLGQLFFHFDFPPEAQFWEHMTIFGGVLAIYLLYQFVSLFHIRDEKRMFDSHTAPTVIGAIVLVALFFSLGEDAIKGLSPLFFASLYSITLFLLVWSGYLLIKIVQKARKIGNAFSLKYYTVSMVPFLAFSLFGVVASSILAEFLYEIFGAALPAYVLGVLIALKIVFYVILSMRLVAFTYLSAPLSQFQSPVSKFVMKARKGHLRL
ncbi:Uncharacterised protein [uncultured archaeon]|nr:Uncharacterised protein [uncultured archaeon]